MHPCLETPSIRGYSSQDRIDLEKIFDLSMDLRTDEAVQRTLESEQKRRKKIWFMPHAGGGMFRPHIFRALFQKDIGGVAGVSDSWFDADLYTVDGGSGKVRSFANYIDQTQILDQPAAGSQVAVPAADAAFNNAKTAVFAGSEYYTSNQTANFWVFLSNGTGYNAVSTLSVISTVPASQAIFATRTGAGVSIGTIFYCATTTLSQAIGNGAANIFAPPPTSASNQVVAGESTYFEISYSETSSPEGVLRKKSATVASGASAGAPSASDPVNTLHWGSFSGGASAIQAKMRSLYLFRRVLATAQRTLMQQFIQSQTNITP